MSERTIWLIDAAYLMKSAPGHFDYLKLKQVLEGLNDGPFWESYYLNSTHDPPTEQEDSFHNWLKSAPPRGPRIRVKLYKLKEYRYRCPECDCQFDKEIQGGVDVGIATLIVRLAAQEQYARLILSAGDGDFEDAIAFVKEVMHKEFWLTGFDGSVSSDLQSYADRMIWLEDYWDEFKRV